MPWDNKSKHENVNFRHWDSNPGWLEWELPLTVRLFSLTMLNKVLNNYDVSWASITRDLRITLAMELFGRQRWITVFFLVVSCCEYEMWRVDQAQAWKHDKNGCLANPAIHLRLLENELLALAIYFEAAEAVSVIFPRKHSPTKFIFYDTRGDLQKDLFIIL